MPDFVSQFADVQPLYVAFTTKLEALLTDLVRNENIDFVKIESRAKSVDSFQEKLERDGKNYTDPLRDITDLSGVRIVTYYDEDVDRICSLISDEFSIDEENSIDKRKIVEQDRFGYLSSHLVVALNEKRTELFEWKQYKELQSEIQVRSVLQHAWAAIDHKLRYKSDDVIPKYLRRKLFRLSALLELADDEFASIKDISEQKSTEIQTNLSTQQFDIEIDRDSIEPYLKLSKTFASYCDYLTGLGFGVKNDSPNDSDFAILVRICKLSKHVTLNDLEKTIAEEIENEGFYTSLCDKLHGASKKHKRITTPAAMRLAIVGNSNAKTAKKILKSVTFKQEVQDALFSLIEDGEFGE